MNDRKAAYALVLAFFDGDDAKATLWYATPNPLLGGISPNDMLKTGRDRNLHVMIVRACEENQPYFRTTTTAKPREEGET